MNIKLVLLCIISIASSSIIANGFSQGDAGGTGSSGGFFGGVTPKGIQSGSEGGIGSSGTFKDEHIKNLESTISQKQQEINALKLKLDNLRKK